jgi:hypothetical protein
MCACVSVVVTVSVNVILQMWSSRLWVCLCVFVYLSVFLSVCLSVCLCVCLSVCLSVCLRVWSVRMSAWLSVSL